MNSRTDSELVGLAAGDGSEAFTELVRRYRDAVYGYCYYRTGNFEDARDLCQEVFILAYRKIAQLREPDKIGAWLRKIAANLCNRWSERRREIPIDEVSLPQSEPESPRAALVREALSGLPDNERLAVVMHYVDGLSYNEIAGFLETRVSTVKGRLYRGREMLKKEVLKMTQEAFGENKLDEEFVLKSARMALDESQRACWELRDPKLARGKAEEAIEILDRLGQRSASVDWPKYEALMRVVHATQDLTEREVLYEKALDFGAQSTDPVISCEALRARVWKLVWKRDLAPAQEALARARDIASKSKLGAQLAFCDIAESDIAFLRGNVKASSELLGSALTRLEEVNPRPGTMPDFTIPWLQAGLMALDSFPSGSAGLLLYYCAGHFSVETDKILFHADPKGNVLVTPDLALSPRLPVLPSALPPFELGWPEPDELLALPPEVGRGWSSETRELNMWYRLDSVVESDNESVAIGLGQFEHCLRVAKRLSGPPREGADLERQIYGTRTIWFAPGIGIVKTVHEPEDGKTVTSELTDYHIAGGDGYLPLEIDNWWRYKWVEGEAEYDCRTQDYVGISARREDGSLVMRRYITCWHGGA